MLDKLNFAALDAGVTVHPLSAEEQAQVAMLIGQALEHVLAFACTHHQADDPDLLAKLRWAIYRKVDKSLEGEREADSVPCVGDQAFEIIDVAIGRVAKMIS
ncbi:MAG: hypothetical protein K2X71_26840 [Methylobacterium sp.]|uniref:hypothetical protein n=1 Tax=Methylobacterium sp. TaxID=409 RepID=UPI00258CF8E1|nr:hypothetical protein [Methylobacterium sp.]MBY0299607.1 hypothetical protein [Methylobacterium sp.]